MDDAAEPEHTATPPDTSKKGYRKVEQGILAILILAACVLWVSLWREMVPPDLTRAQTRALARKILENTPEGFLPKYVTWPEGTVFSWVLLLPPKHSTMPSGLLEEVTRLLKQKYTVYTQEQDVPDDQVGKSGDDVRSSPHGFRFRFDVSIHSGYHGGAIVEYYDFEGVANLHWRHYHWSRGDWEIIDWGIGTSPWAKQGT